MKGLSLWQPWASLMAIGEKRIETRSFKVNYRGPIALCSAKHRESPDLLMEAPFREVLVKFGLIRIAAPAFEDDELKAGGVTDLMPYGQVLAIATLRAIRPTIEVLETVSKDTYRPRHELSFGNYEAGRYAWIFSDFKPLLAPVEIRGRQGLFTLSATEQAKIRQVAA